MSLYISHPPLMLYPTQSSFCPAGQVRFHLKSVSDNKCLTEPAFFSSQRMNSSQKAVLLLKVAIVVPIVSITATGPEAQVVGNPL